MSGVSSGKAAGGGGGSVATDTLWDAKGDLAVGTGADTAAKLAVGTNNQVLTADSSQTTGLKWAAGGGASGGTPALVFDTTNLAGVASTFIREDDQLALFDATAPSTQAIGDSAATGSAAIAARRDHKHAMPAFATNAVVLGSAAAAGAATTLVRSDATIAAFDTTVPTTINRADAAAVGTAAFAARRDHLHGFSAAAVGAVVDTSETTTSATYADLTTPGPSVTVTVGTSGMALVNFSTTYSTSSGVVRASVLVDAVTPTDATALSNSGTNVIRAGSSELVTGLSAGSHTFKLQYKTSAGTATFANRHISVVPL